MRKALVVEDDADIVELVSLYLGKDGWDVESVADGRRALERVRRGSYQLIILDIQLPDLDGFAVCDHLALEAHAPPIVLTSTRDISSYRRRLAQSSARGFIAKSDLTGAALAAIVTALVSLGSAAVSASIRVTPARPAPTCGPSPGHG
jgi:DNA-binding response OmpR family regulator